MIYEPSNFFAAIQSTNTYNTAPSANTDSQVIRVAGVLLWNQHKLRLDIDETLGEIVTGIMPAIDKQAQTVLLFGLTFCERLKCGAHFIVVEINY